MKKSKSTLTLLTVLIIFNTFAQSKEFENVVDVEVRNTVEITNNKQIVGYAFFYKMDKIKKSAMYRLTILDENLKEIGNTEFECPKDLQLKRAVYESNQCGINSTVPNLGKSKQDICRSPIHPLNIYSIRGRYLTGHCC